MGIVHNRKSAKSRILSLMCTTSFAAGLLTSSFAQVPAKVVATQDQIVKYFGTKNVKLVFSQTVNKVNSVFFVDFSQATPTIKKLVNNTSNISLPVISPDGEYVVYRDGNGDAQENEVCPSPTAAKVMMTKLAEASTPIQVAATGFSPRFDYSTASPKYSVVYPNSFCNGAVGAPYPHDPGGPKTVKTLIDATSGTPVVGVTTDVWANGGYNAGISRNGKYLAAQYPGEDVFMIDISSTTNKAVSLKTYAAKTIAGKDTIISTNTCNGSISSSTLRPDAILFYTGSLGSSKVSTSFGIWGAHQRLVVKSFANEILQTIDVPKELPICTETGANPTPGGCNGLGEIVGVEWWNPEWSNHPYFTVGAIQPDRLFQVNGNWEHKQRGEYIYAANLKDSLLIRLLQATDTTYTSTINMIYPWLWVSTSGFTETPGYLGSAIKVPLKGFSQGGFLSLDKGLIASSSAFSNVSVFSALGSKVWDSGSLTSKTRALTLPKVRTGIYFVKVTIPGAGSPNVIKWNVSALK